MDGPIVELLGRYAVCDVHYTCVVGKQIDIIRWLASRDHLIVRYLPQKTYEGIEGPKRST